MYWLSDRSNWSPLADLRNMQREINRMFDGYDSFAPISRYPAINIWGNNEQVVVTAELPGLVVEDFDISVVDNQLTIQGERKSDEPAEDVVCHRAERNTGKFTRTIRLPYSVDNDKVEARYEHGILMISLPRHEATKPKKVEINAG